MTDITEAPANADLVALRARIGRHAARQVRGYNITAEWINPWLRKMGVEELAGSNGYTIEVPITAKVRVTAAGTTRAQAIKNAQEYAGKFGRIRSRMTMRDVTADAENWTVVDGPEDPAPGDVNEIPQTVDALKAMLRDCLKAAKTDPNGPHSCTGGIRDEWRTFQLGDFPTFRTVSVRVPVTATVEVNLDVVNGEDTDTEQARAYVAARGEFHAIEVKPTEAPVAVEDDEDDDSEDDE